MNTKPTYRRLALLLAVVLCFSLTLQISAATGKADSKTKMEHLKTKKNLAII